MKVTSEIARIHAHVCGDGYVSVTKENRSRSDALIHPRRNWTRIVWTFAYCNTSKKLIKEFQNDLRKEFNRSGLYIPKKFEIRVRGAKHIIKLLELENKNSRNWIVPKFVTNSSNKILANWIRAFFDDEATVAVDRKAILVGSVNKKGLIQISRLLKRFKIKSKVKGPYSYKQYFSWRLSIRSENVERYYKKISFIHPEKLEKLKKIEMGRGGVS